MLFIIRFIRTCCNCTRSPMTRGRSATSSVRTSTPNFVASLCSRSIISRMISFGSTNSRCRVSCWKSRRTRLTISFARLPSCTILDAAARTSSKSGSSRASHRKQVLALVMTAAIGCLISCASEAVSSPMLLIRLARVRSACACRSASSACFRSAICASNFALISASCPACCSMPRTRNL